MGETARQCRHLKALPVSTCRRREAYAGCRLRLCFANPSHEQIREGVAVLAEVCAKEFGVPARIANVEKQVRA